MSADAHHDDLAPSHGTRKSYITGFLLSVVLTAIPFYLVMSGMLSNLATSLIVIVSDLFVEPELLRSCFQHLRFRRHDVAVFHLLDPQELAFAFRRPMRFLDMEGGPAIFAEPNEIADRYQKALAGYLDALTGVVRESAVDYHRVSLVDDYEQVLMRFLVGRTRARGVR